jgi:hypothetical protein
MFVGKDETYPSEAPFKCSTLMKYPGLTHKQHARLGRPASENTSFLGTLVNYSCKSFITLPIEVKYLCQFLTGGVIGTIKSLKRLLQPGTILIKRFVDVTYSFA